MRRSRWPIKAPGPPGQAGEGHGRAVRAAARDRGFGFTPAAGIRPDDRIHRSTHAAHLRSRALRVLLEGIPPPFLLGLEADGGLARAVSVAGETVGFLNVTPEREAMIAIHPDHQGKGVATAALTLARDIALNEKAMHWVSAMAGTGRPSSGLLARFGAVEVDRSGDVIRYHIVLADA